MEKYRNPHGQLKENLLLPFSRGLQIFTSGLKRRNNGRNVFTTYAMSIIIMTIYSTLIPFRINNMYMYVCSNTSNNIIPWEDGFNLSIVVHIILNLNPSSTCIVCGLWILQRPSHLVQLVQRM